MRPGIDHVYVRGFNVTSVAKTEIAAHELPGGTPTDHPAFIADVR